MSEISIIKFGNQPGDSVQLRPFPKRPFLAVKVFREEHGSIYALNAKGEIFTTAARRGGIYTGVGRRQASILLSLHKMGVFKNDRARVAADAAKKSIAADSRAYSANRVLEEAKDAGIELTPAQLSKIAAIKRAAK